jgi:hypothetical protein
MKRRTKKPTEISEPTIPDIMRGVSVIATKKRQQRQPRRARRGAVTLDWVAQDAEARALKKAAMEEREAADPAQLRQVGQEWKAARWVTAVAAAAAAQLRICECEESDAAPIFES